MHHPLPAIWFACLFPVFWIAVCLLISHFSGWFRLGGRFKAEKPAGGSSFNFVSGSMNHGLRPVFYAISFRSCLIVSFDPTGLSLKMLAPFRPGHPPLLIPWSGFQSAGSERRWLMQSAVLVVRDPAVTICILGKAGRSLLEFISSRNLVQNQ